MRRATTGKHLLVGLLVLTGMGAAYASFRDFPAWEGINEVLVIGLAVLLELLRLDLFTYQQAPGSERKGERKTISAGVAAIFLVIALYGVQVAVIVALLQAIMRAIIKKTVWYKALFNAGLFATSAYLAGEIYLNFGGAATTWGAQAVVASVGAAGLYFLLQSFCVAGVISISMRSPYWSVLSDIRWTILQQAVIGMLGLLLGRFAEGGTSILGMCLLITPLILLRYSYHVFAERVQVYVRQIEQANLDLARLNGELRATNDELIQTLGCILDARDRYTFGHSAQVATYSVALGEKLNLGEERLERLRQAALLHDIGKVGIPESILLKPGPLDPYERSIMQAHAEIGYRITNQVHSLSKAASLIRQHHEWVGGGGYPRNLKGDQILLEARVIAVADALDTLLSDRPYRKGKPVPDAIAEMRRWRSVQFDSDVVGALEKLLEERGEEWFKNSAMQVGNGVLAVEVAASLAAQAEEQSTK